MEIETDDLPREIDEDIVDPIHDIIDFLVRCANISFKNSHVDETQLKTSDKVEFAHSLFKNSPADFLERFGKHLSPYHLSYFENLQNDANFRSVPYNECLKYLKDYHSEKSRHKRIRNRRYRALQKMKMETDYFSEKQMMFRNPLLYDQLIGQYLDENDILERDSAGETDMTFLNVILNTVDMNEMRETKHKQMLHEDVDTEENTKQAVQNDKIIMNKTKKKRWGEFDEPDTLPEPQFQKPVTKLTISSQEQMLLREEFFQEMFSSFLDGRDEDFDYTTIDNNEQYDDLQQISQDAEDKYFDEELNDNNNLEEHMNLIEEYGKKNSLDIQESCDPLDVFMKQIENKNYT